MPIYAIRTTSGQEKTVAELLLSRVKLKKLPVYSILVPEIIKGYIFVEAPSPHFIDEVISRIKHARARTPGKIEFKEIEKFLITKPVIEELSIGDTVEITGGPFRGLKAKITGIDKVKGEVTIELLEEGFSTLPITVHSEYIRIIEKGKA